MQQFRLFQLLLKPSLLSGLAASLVSLLILGVGNWLYAERSSFFSQYLFGRYGLVTNLQQSQGNIWEAALGLFDKPFSYNIVILLAAIVCGALVYIALESVTRSVDSVHETWEEIRYAERGSRHLIEVELGTRWIIRSLAIGAWLAYWVAWLSAVLPFCLLATRLLFSDSLQPISWFYAGLGLAVCWLGLHLHVIFVRLILLRPRVFGHSSEVEIASYDQH